MTPILPLSDDYRKAVVINETLKRLGRPELPLPEINHDPDLRCAHCNILLDDDIDGRLQRHKYCSDICDSRARNLRERDERNKNGKLNK